MHRRHCPQVKLQQEQAGFSLLELSIVVLILGIMALVVIPDSAPTLQHRLDLAAQEVANAMRFARSESIRLGEPHGFRQKSSKRRIRVFRVDTGTAPWEPVYDVYHPISKKLYDIKFDDHPLSRIDDLKRSKVFRGTCNDPRNIYFNAAGIAYCVDPETVLCEQFKVEIILGGLQRDVILDGISGRVIIQ